MEKKKLIEVLTGQHQVLRADLASIAEGTHDKALLESGEIIARLKKFKVDLSVHLKVENELFYPEYLANKLKKHEDATMTENFIAEMVKIGEGVTSFLERYSTKESINEQLSFFQSDLVEVTETLTIRLDTEETGVFKSYLMSE